MRQRREEVGRHPGSRHRARLTGDGLWVFLSFIFPLSGFPGDSGPRGENTSRFLPSLRPHARGRSAGSQAPAAPPATTRCPRPVSRRSLSLTERFRSKAGVGKELGCAVVCAAPRTAARTWAPPLPRDAGQLTLLHPPGAQRSPSFPCPHGGLAALWVSLAARQCRAPGRPSEGRREEGADSEPSVNVLPALD